MTGMRQDTQTRRGRGCDSIYHLYGDIRKVTCKYMRVGDGDGECKTRPHPFLLPCLLVYNLLIYNLYQLIII